MASSDKGYWSRSWELLARDEGWIKPVLVLAAARFVPIVGAFGADGYALEWARLTSWGVDSSPKQKGVDTYACIRTGAKAFVVSLGYLLAFWFVRMVIGTVFGAVLGSLLALALTMFISVVVAVAQLRATIYQTIGAGYQLNRIFDMIERDYKGLLRITGLVTVMALILSILISLAFSVVMVASMGGTIAEIARMGMYNYVDEWEVASTFLRGLAAALPVVCIFLFGVSILHTITNLITMTSVGLWMRQFDVTNWGESSDELPAAASPNSASAAQYSGSSATYASTPQSAGTTSYQAGQGVPTASEPATSANEAYGYGSRTGSWDDTRVDAASSETSPAAGDVPEIPILPIESFEDGAAEVPAPSEPETFDLQSADMSSTAEAADVPETFGLWDVAETANASQAASPESSEPQEADASLAQASSEGVAAFDLQDMGSLAAPEDASIDSMPLEAFGSPETDQAEDMTEERPSEVESFPLFDTPEPTSSFPRDEDASDHVDQGEMPEIEEFHALEPHHRDEPLSEEEVLRRTEEAIRASDMTAWDIPQSAQPSGSVTSFDLDDFEGGAPAAEPVLEIPEVVVPEDADADKDEPAQSQFEQFMDTVIDHAEVWLLDDVVDARDVAIDESEDDVSEQIVDSVMISGKPDEEPVPEADPDTSDTEGDA